MNDNAQVDIGDTETVEQIRTLLNSKFERRSQPMMENHAQTVIVFIILAVLSWVGYSIIETEKAVHEANVSMRVMKNDIDYMKRSLDAATSNYITKNEYIITLEQIRKDLAHTDARVEGLEIHVKEHHSIHAPDD